MEVALEQITGIPDRMASTIGIPKPSKKGTKAKAKAEKKAKKKKEKLNHTNPNLKYFIG